mgnify:CR=1 FL=1
MKNRVVITGLGVVCSNASNLEEFKSALFQGKSGVRHIQEFQDLGFRCHVGGIARLPEELPEFFAEYELGEMSEFIQLACVAGVEAWKNAGLEVPHYETTQVDWDTGVIIGVGTPGVEILGGKIIPLTNEKKVKKIGGLGHLNIMPVAASSWLSSILSTGNISSANSMACATGVNAILQGYQHIASGGAKRMLVGSTEGYSSYSFATLDAMRVTSSKMNDTPEQACRPLSATANGLVPATGAGVLVLESLESALERGASIIAEIIGGNSNSGGQKNGGTSTFPNNHGVVRCLAETLRVSEIAAQEVDLINGHFTATKADPVEFKNWLEVFGKKDLPMFNATKSLIGHAINAAGAIECVACILQMRDGFVHPAINCEDLHPEIEELLPEGNIAIAAAIEKPINVIMKGSFGFGDVNASIIFKKYNSNE